MKDIFQVVEKVKQIKGLNTDTEVAKALGMSYEALVNRKTRRSVPCKEVVEFCEREGISIDTVLSDAVGEPRDYVYVQPYEGAKKDFLAFRKDWAEDTFKAKPKNLRYFIMEGDSMAPTIINRDTVLVDLGATEPKDGICLVRLGKSLMVKRIQVLPGEKLKVKSDNEQAYEPFVVDFNKLDKELFMIGRIVWAGRSL